MKKKNVIHTSNASLVAAIKNTVPLQVTYAHKTLLYVQSIQYMVQHWKYIEGRIYKRIHTIMVAAQSCHFKSLFLNTPKLCVYVHSHIFSIHTHTEFLTCVYVCRAHVCIGFSFFILFWLNYQKPLFSRSLENTKFFFATNYGCSKCMQYGC